MKLNLAEIYEVVRLNRYTIQPDKKYISRDFCGDYEPDPNLPALSLPGGDIGQLAVLFTTANAYGFEVDVEKAIKILLDIIGGKDNFSFHYTLSKDIEVFTLQCPYIKTLRENPEDFSLTPEYIALLENQTQNILPSDKSFFTKEQGVEEGAILIVKGNYGIYPRFSFVTDDGVVTGNVYIYHQTLINERHKLFAHMLVEQNAVTLYEGCDEEYLYEVLSETADNHLFNSLQHFAANLPLFTVSFKSDGTFIVKEE